MKLEAAQEIYEKRSTRLSEIVRQLNFAGIAVIWLFRTGEKTGGIPYNDVLLWPLSLFITSSAFDLLQSAYASAAWGIFSRQQEKKLNLRLAETDDIDDEIDDAPRAINWVSNVFFWGKAILTASGYFLLIRYLAAHLIANSWPLK